MRSGALKKQAGHVSIWVERPKQANLREVKKSSHPAQPQAVLPEDDMESPDFEAFMRQYGRWSDFA